MYKLFKYIMCCALLYTLFSFSDSLTVHARKNAEDFNAANRVQISEKNYKKIFGDDDSDKVIIDPELENIMKYFVYGEVYEQGNLTNKQRALITLAVLTTNQNIEQLAEQIKGALNIGVTPVEIKEVFHQCAPYIGFPKALNALQKSNQVFKEQGIELPLESQATVKEENRFVEGLKVQKSIFGERIDQLHANAPLNQKHIQNYLSAFCFGDTYTRAGLDLKTRELLTLSIIATLGGCDSQVKSHVQGNVQVGNDKETLIAAVTQCLPYIGFPRTLNALNCINEVLPENK